MAEETTKVAPNDEGAAATATGTKPKRSRRTSKPTESTQTKTAKPSAKPQKFEHRYPITKGPTCAVCGTPLSSAITKGELACPYGHPQPKNEED